MYFLHPEDAAGQCAGLIEYYGIYMGNGVQIVTAFEQIPRREAAPDSSEIAQRYAGPPMQGQEMTRKTNAR